MKVTRFEDLITWQKARELRKTIYTVSGQGEFSQDWDMRKQIRSAALSVMSNIAEGFDRNAIPQFLYFLKIANASCAEVRSHLYAAFDEGYVTQQMVDRLLQRAKEVSRLIRGLAGSLIFKLGTGHRAQGTNNVS